MKITKVIIRNFKRFQETEFVFPGDSIVIAGPNNTGKTTLLQAVSAWRLALDRWLELGNTNPGTGYARAPMSRQSFFSVPLRNFNMLWSNGNPTRGGVIEIEVFFGADSYTMEIEHNSTEQIYVRPKKDSSGANFFNLFNKERSNMVFVPAMTGIVMDEPLYQPAKIKEFLGQGRTGDVLRNLLAEVHKKDSWENLQAAIKDIFGCEILPPATGGANIRAEYLHNGARLDIASAGSGFLQVLMLLAFLSAEKNAVLLLDEPDAHLHILLQDRIFAMLKKFAKESDSQLIMATHSERIINVVEPRHLCVLLDKPKIIADNDEKNALITALTVIDNTDIMLANNAAGVLYVEGRTDIELLREWARVLNHPLLAFLEEPFWKPTVQDSQGGGIKSEEHYKALRLAHPCMVAVELQDGDGYNRNTKINILQSGMARFYWQRYEIESYLVHPNSIAAFVQEISGQQEAADLALLYLQNNLPPAVFEKPLDKHDYLENTKAKTNIISPVLQAAGLHNLTDYWQIAARMSADAVHPEIVDKLDAIAEHFGITP